LITKLRTLLSRGREGAVTTQIDWVEKRSQIIENTLEPDPFFMKLRRPKGVGDITEIPMLEKANARPDLLLLLSLLLVVLVYPLVDHGEFRPFVLGALMFVPVITATLRLADTRGPAWPRILLATAVLVVSAASVFIASRPLVGAKWLLLTVFFGITVARLFSYLGNADRVDRAHLYTAASIYLLLGMVWFALYSAIDTISPGTIRFTDAASADHQPELLYFSLITLATVGYGDVVPVNGEVRILAAMEGITGVLYVAITVALLVSAYKTPKE
jgi:hypothetical protein